MNNVKPGQRVICVSTPCIPAAHELAKLLVRNVGAIGTVESLDHISGFVGTVWQVKCETHWWALGPEGYVMQVMPGQTVAIGDYYLRPLQWTGEEDETLSIAGYPPSIAMDKDPVGFVDKILKEMSFDYPPLPLRWSEDTIDRIYRDLRWLRSDQRPGNPPASDPFR